MSAPKSNRKNSKRSSELLKNYSCINIFHPPSTSSEDDSKTGVHKGGVTLAHNTKLVSKLINNYFDEKTGNFEASSSSCSSVQVASSAYSFDKRLKYWKNVLHERTILETNIKNKTGKQSSAVLFNRSSTVDERDKQTIKRLLDYAERMNPITLMTKKQATLPEYTDCERDIHINELQETWPRAEREAGKILEISGLPAVTKREMFGKPKERSTEQKSQWLKSKVLERRIEEKREDIERVIEYYPDIENLQIVGESLIRMNLPKHNSEIELLQEERIQKISSETSVCDDEDNVQAETKSVEQLVDYAMKINDQIFRQSSKRSSKNVEVTICFECEPFEKVVKRVLRIENVGKKVLNCEWSHRAFYDRNDHLLQSTDQEFVFNAKPFRLISGEVHEVRVQFQPRKVNIIKMKWVLKIEPQFFCRRMDAIVVKLCGICRPPVEYVNILNEIQKTVIDKSNFKLMRKLTMILPSLAPLNQPTEVMCPYKRTLQERELFEFQNVGHQCDRYHDLELLRGIYKRVKKPREPAWDLKLDTLKEFILRLESADQRALVFNEMLGILQGMKGCPLQAKAVEQHPEHERTRLLYVRGIISSAIDDWEEMTVSVEEAFLKPALKEYYADVLAAEEEQSAETQTLKYTLLDEEAIRKELVKKVRRRKAFRDSLYMKTYTHLCNFVEDIVSVIESTEMD